MKPVMPLEMDRMGPGERTRLTLEILVTYLRVRWEMRGDDAERALKALRADVAGESTIELERRHEQFVAWRLSKSMEKVLSRLPSDSRCLFSSLTLACMLERRGIPQKLLIAVRPTPFAAHAWIEVDGKAVLPDADPGYEKLLEL